MTHQQHRLIRRLPAVSAFLRRSSWPPDDDDHHKEVKSASARRLVLLLLMLMLILLLYDAIFPLSILAPADSENYRKFKSMKTHIQVKQSRLQARKEKPNISSSSSSSSQIPCSKLINGEKDETSSPWTGAADGLLCCDRSNNRTDVCYLRGDIRTSPGSSSIFLYNARHGSSAPEKIRPYTRKFEPEIMQSVQELSLVPVSAANASTPRKQRCDVTHRGVPAVVFSAGGYTGNMYHEFSDGLIPLYVTSRHFTATSAAEGEGEVVLVVADYRRWWASKYRLVFKRMSKYRIVDLAADHRVHCFSEMIVGLRFHGELVIDPHQMPNGEGIQDFQALIRQALDGEPAAKPRKSRQRRQQSQLPPPPPLPLLPPSSEDGEPAAKPKMVIFVRNRTRVLLNLQEIVEACEEAGFRVQVLDAKQHTPLAAIHRSVASSQAMLAVHGAAATHFLFMRPPGAALVQIVPIGLDWAADAFYGVPARRLGLRYVEYKVSAEESSLSADYDRRSPVLADPSVVASKGWWEMKKVYMDSQNVRVNVTRFSRVLQRLFLLQ